MQEVNGSDLLNGSDHEFVVNLYSVLLNRWPDEDGYRHHLQRVENRPEMRRQLIDEIAGSPEGRNLGVIVRWPDAAPAAAASAVAAALPAAAAPGDLASTLAQLCQGLATMEAAVLIETQRLLAETLATVAAHQAAQLEARIARLEGRQG
ncbi:DUF4214 domain-containing protein [Neoroseomonas lacus]|uniref:DUF4214 domain-containing protein n=1 Tax=Neoroseomonas lacus TaxID=287609 RepID=A0A917NXY2_9PROT|nr:DUF4214 domain-containing protein [Neoroseomonas lacus]GGJ40044.1 hypothetical protein GCM10011320_54630 [Neoroseomonas lacus]